MPEIAMAEGRKKQSPKVLDHLKIKAQLGGGHIVEHVYEGYQHDPKPVKFNEEGKSQGGEHILKHLTKHAGLPPMTSADGGEGDETEDE